MNSKQECIAKAYGEIGLPYHENICVDNGWIKINPGRFSSKYHLLDLLKLTDHVYSIRPKSIQGIENNNGWIKIESEEDLPKENAEYYWTVTENDKNIKERWFNKFFNQYEGEGKVTHYQPITKPEPPLH